MFIAALGSLGQRLDTKFVAAYFLPAFVAVLGTIAIVIRQAGDATFIAWVAQFDSLQQGVIILGLLLGTLMVAYLLQALARPIAEAYAGRAYPELVRRRLLPAQLADRAHTPLNARSYQRGERLFPREPAETGADRLRQYLGGERRLPPPRLRHGHVLLVAAAASPSCRRRFWSRCRRWKRRCGKSCHARRRSVRSKYTPTTPFGWSRRTLPRRHAKRVAPGAVFAGDGRLRGQARSRRRAPWTTHLRGARAAAQPRAHASRHSRQHRRRSGRSGRRPRRPRRSLFGIDPLPGLSLLPSAALQTAARRAACDGGTCVGAVCAPPKTTAPAMATERTRRWRAANRSFVLMLDDAMDEGRMGAGLMDKQTRPKQRWRRLALAIALLSLALPWFNPASVFATHGNRDVGPQVINGFPVAPARIGSWSPCSASHGAACLPAAILRRRDHRAGLGADRRPLRPRASDH